MLYILLYSSNVTFYHLDCILSFQNDTEISMFLCVASLLIDERNSFLQTANDVYIVIQKCVPLCAKRPQLIGSFNSFLISDIH